MIEPKYKKQDILNVIKAKKLHFVEDVTTELGMHRSTFYKSDFHNDADILAAIESNKLILKRGLRQKWYNEDNATLQIALYKLLSNDDECHKLNGTKTEQKIEHEFVTPIIEFGDDEEEDEVIEDGK